MRILLLQPCPRQAARQKRMLERAGYAVDLFTDRSRAAAYALANYDDYDLLVLTCCSDAAYAAQFCHTLRANGAATLVLCLARRLSSEGAKKVLEAGADAFLRGHYGEGELLAQVQALLRRTKEAFPPVLEVDSFSLNPATREAWYKGEKLDLTLKEFALLRYFLRHPNCVVEREQLMSHLWDAQAEGFSNVVDVHVKNLRRKLGGAGKGLVKTVRGVGYLFQASRSSRILHE